MSSRRSVRDDPAAYLMSRTVLDENGCWIWQLTKSPGGYGTMSVGAVARVRAHRWAYEQLVGPIPDGLHLDHLCRVRACVNPAHLEPVTQAENNRRSTSPSAINAQRTECANGHPFDEANTYWRKSGSRTCRACMVQYKRDFRARRGFPYRGGRWSA